MTYHQNDTVQMTAQTVTGVGAANWGSVEFFDTNLVTDLAGLGGMEMQVAYALIAVSAALTLAGVYQSAMSRR